jgi:hypothetical protein
MNLNALYGKSINHIRHLSSFKNSVIVQSYCSKNKTKMVGYEFKIKIESNFTKEITIQ